MPAPNDRPIGGSTRFCAVYGHPIQHSASPALQNAGIATLGLDWRYLAFDVHPDDLKTAIAGAKAMKFIGLNLTVPHKLLAISMVDVLDWSGNQFGAINTIRFEARDSSGQWQPLGLVPPHQAHPIRSVGFNTDADAVAQALREDLGLNLPGLSVLLLGVGGAGRVAALQLAREGVGRLFLVNRTASKAEEIARELRAQFPHTDCVVGYPTGQIDLVLNATSLGLKTDDPLPLDVRRFSWAQAAAVYDMIYRPAETPFLLGAKAAGCRTANGLSMLLYQGARALEIWTGQPPPVSVMRQALELNVYGR